MKIRLGELSDSWKPIPPMSVSISCGKIVSSASSRSSMSLLVGLWFPRREPLRDPCDREVWLPELCSDRLPNDVAWPVGFIVRFSTFDSISEAWFVDRFGEFRCSKFEWSRIGPAPQIVAMPNSKAADSPRRNKQYMALILEFRMLRPYGA